MSHFARITQDQRRQSLCVHLRSVSNLASEGLPDFLKEIAYYAGLWHDIGKYSPKWQDYLLNKGNMKPHAFQGARIALEWAENEGIDEIPAISYVIAGHHTHLRSQDNLLDEYPSDSDDWKKCLEIAQTEINNLLPKMLPEINLPVLRREFAIRVLFSALVDADRFNAMEFEAGNENPALELRNYQLVSILASKSNLSSLPESKTKIDELRNVFADYCIKSAEKAKGFYRLTGVCGIGKTLSSLRFAYFHAQKHQMKGIIYVAPLKVIIEQTAKIYKEQLGEDNVLEHHSDYEPTLSEYVNYKLDTERWDKSYIVTTGVQFFESLFSHKPSRCRKLHNIINRVILIDEAQTIPPKFASCILDVLNTLVKDYGCTVVLMSATQPAFDRLKRSEIKDINFIDIIEKDEIAKQFKCLKRVTYRSMLDTSWTWNDLAQDIKDSKFKQSLTVVNTTQLAREGYYQLKELVGGDWYHLSSRMCPAHRSQIINYLPKNNEDWHKSCHLISTSIVEAGVDLDFPRVYRQLTSLDSIIQTAGRGNRNGFLEYIEAIVTIFELAEDNNKVDENLRKRINITKNIIDKDPQALDKKILESIDLYFKQIYTQWNDSEIQGLRKQYDYPEVAKAFKLIDEDYKISVLCPWDRGIQHIEELQNKENLILEDYRKIQPYSAMVSQKQAKQDKLVKKCENGLNIWRADYDEHTGCSKT